ncbi:hypothetical protein LguiB_013286 [Lonicera macranthoides]
MAEAIAIREACIVGACRNISGLVICSDSKFVISLISSDLDPPWDIEALVVDIRRFAVAFDFKFIFVRRYQNIIANSIVQAVLRDSLPCNSVSTVPSSIRRLLERLRFELKAFSLKGDSSSLGLCFACFFPFSRLWNKELFALREQIENVNTGLSEDLILKCLTESIYCSSDRFQDEGTCVICLHKYSKKLVMVSQIQIKLDYSTDSYPEEYKNMDDVGMLRGCRTSTTSSPSTSVNGKGDVTIGDLGLAAILRKSHAAYWTATTALYWVALSLVRFGWLHSSYKEYRYSIIAAPTALNGLQPNHKNTLEVLWGCGGRIVCVVMINGEKMGLKGVKIRHTGHQDRSWTPQDRSWELSAKAYFTTVITVGILVITPCSRLGLG